MATAAKIDAIESEMAKDFLRPRKVGAEPGVTVAPEARREPPEAALPPPVEEPSNAAVGATPVAEPEGRSDSALSEEEAFDPGTDVLVGSLDAIEVSGASSSVLEETAILFANCQDHAAESGLRNALNSESLGPLTERGWLMLLELLQQRNDKLAFDQLSSQFALRFAAAAPEWLNYAEDLPAANTGAPMIRLPEFIDAGIVGPLEEFKALAATHASLNLDLRAARQVDLTGAELLLRVFNAFKRASHDLTILGAEQLLVVLRSTVEPGRRDASDAAWMLLLEVQRLLDRQADFEETGIQYCITYEVSPPSWEPPLPNIHVGGVTAVAHARGAPDALDWKGDIQGDGEPFFSSLAGAARGKRRLYVDCGKLRRVAFTASMNLLAQLSRLQQQGTVVEFHNVNCLIGTLWQLLGVTAMCEVRPRRS